MYHFIIFAIAFAICVILVWKQKTTFLPVIPIIWLIAEITILVVFKQPIFIPIAILWFCIVEVIFLYYLGKLRLITPNPGEIIIVSRLGKIRKIILARQMVLEGLSIDGLVDKTPTPSIFGKAILLLPFFDKIVATYSIKLEWYNVPPQTITTLDPTDVTVDVSIRHRTVNPFQRYYVNFDHLITDATNSVLRDIVGKMYVEDITKSVTAISQKVKEALSQKIDLNWGEEISDIYVQDLHLPEEIKEKMKEVRLSQLDVDIAEKRKQKDLIDADAKAEAIRRVAKGKADEAIANGTAQAEVFAAQLRAAKEVGGEAAMDKLLYNMGLEKLGSKTIITGLPGAEKSSAVDINSVIVAQAIENAAKNAPVSSAEDNTPADTPTSDETEESP